MSINIYTSEAASAIPKFINEEMWKHRRLFTQAKVASVTFFFVVIEKKSGVQEIVLA